MKILALDVTNVKRVRAVHIEPGGAVVIEDGCVREAATEAADGGLL